MNTLPLKREWNALLAKAFDESYARYRAPYYSMRFRCGKYSIYRTEIDETLNRQHSTTLAKGLTKEQAEGMMKLLENQDEQ